MRRRESRGFFSIDALFALTLLLTITAAFLNIYEGRRASAEGIGANLEAKMIGEKVASAINTVYANGPNFSLKVDLPENISGYSYKISLDNSIRRISVENSAWGTVAVPIVCKNVKNFVLNQENMKRQIRVFWEGSQLRIVNL
jgi:hypothetical protein